MSPNGAPAPVRVLAVSGSLRAGGSNDAVLDAARLLAPAGVEVVRYGGLRTLPAFDPDLDTPAGDALPRGAAELRAAVGGAGALLISSPEYAHGIPGALKNALDWLVGSVEFPGKPVALLNTSAWSVHAPAQLAEVLTTMNARLVAEAGVTVPLLGRTLDGAGVAADPALAASVRGVLVSLVALARAGAGSSVVSILDDAPAPQPPCASSTSPTFTSASASTSASRPPA